MITLFLLALVKQCKVEEERNTILFQELIKHTWELWEIVF